MKRVCVSVSLAVPFILCTLGARAGDADKAVKEELKRLEGTWVLKENWANGKETSKEIRIAELTIKEDVLKMGKIEFQIVVDPSKKPKTIDRLVKRSDGKDLKINEGIYELDGDKLTICVTAPRAGSRPKELKPGAGVTLSVYERKKEN